MRFVCGPDGPEDLVAVPRTSWLVSSAIAGDGGIYVVDTAKGRSIKVFPTATSAERLDAATYASCPGPLQGEDRTSFRTHGLYLKAGGRSTHTLYAVHHGGRESIEVFTFDAGTTPPKRHLDRLRRRARSDRAQRSRGPAGRRIRGDELRPASAVGCAGAGVSAKVLSGERNGEVWEWHPKTGWAKVPGSEASGANGLELSADGKWYYVAQWGNRAFMRLSRGKTPVERQEIPVGFRVDNLRWSRDGTDAPRRRTGPRARRVAAGRGTSGAGLDHRPHRPAGDDVRGTREASRCRRASSPRPSRSKWAASIGRGRSAATASRAIRFRQASKGMHRLIVGSIAAALACASATAVVHVQSDAGAPAFSRTDLVPPPTAGWPTNGGNLSNQRYAPLTEINRDNVARLKGVWRTRLRGSGIGPQYSGEAQPLVFNGVIYIVTGADDVFAVGVDTGNILWEYRANLDPNIDSVCCGWTSRGVGLGDGKVFVGQLDGRLLALDQRTGKVAWSIQAERWQEGFTIPSAPLYYDGLVITGFAGAEKGIRGRVKAYNAKDGSLVWTFYTIPGPGEFGHDTWPKDNDLWQDGGASIWHTPAVDPELGLLYFGTGNPGPDYNGAGA